MLMPREDMVHVVRDLTRPGAPAVRHIEPHEARAALRGATSCTEQAFDAAHAPVAAGPRGLPPWSDDAPTNVRWATLPTRRS